MKKIFDMLVKYRFLLVCLLFVSFMVFYTMYHDRYVKQVLRSDVPSGNVQKSESVVHKYGLICL